MMDTESQKTETFHFHIIQTWKRKKSYQDDYNYYSYKERLEEIFHHYRLHFQIY
jgi:hypothetical protein